MLVFAIFIRHLVRDILGFRNLKFLIQSSNSASPKTARNLVPKHQSCYLTPSNPFICQSRTAFLDFPNFKILVEYSNLVTPKTPRNQIPKLYYMELFFKLFICHFEFSKFKNFVHTFEFSVPTNTQGKKSERLGPFYKILIRHIGFAIVDFSNWKFCTIIRIRRS